MPIPNVTPYTGTLPDINDPATFDARMTAFTTWFNGVVTEIEATVSGMNTALNDDGTTLDTAGQALRVSLNANTTATTAGSASAYTLAPADTITAYADGESFRASMHVTNAQNATINIDGLGAIPIRKLVGGALVGLDAGDLLAGEIHLFEIVSGGTIAKLISQPISDLLLPVGAIQDFARATPPGGWLVMNGGTIGAPGSGATSLEAASAEALFSLLWDEFSNTILPIQDSLGAASTRGASAAADFAANKRLPLHDMRGEFRRTWDNGRGVDIGRVLGSAQADEIASHAHQQVVNGYDQDRGLITGAATSGTDVARTPEAANSNTLSTGGAETRPRNVAWLTCIKF